MPAEGGKNQYFVYWDEDVGDLNELRRANCVTFIPERSWGSRLRAVKVRPLREEADPATITGALVLDHIEIWKEVLLQALRYLPVAKVLTALAKKSENWPAEEVSDLLGSMPVKHFSHHEAEPLLRFLPPLTEWNFLKRRYGSDPTKLYCWQRMALRLATEGGEECLEELLASFPLELLGSGPMCGIGGIGCSIG
jgi:hypothetical protein